MPLTVFLYGGPGIGKSTFLAQLFAELKTRGRNVEAVHEVAKGLTWEKRDVALSHQAYINAKQMFHMDRLQGQVDVIVTDTSTLLGLVYGTDMTTAFTDWLVDDYRRRNTLNILLERDPSKAYNSSGRRQTEREAVAFDATIGSLLDSLEIPYIRLPVGANSIPALSDLIEDMI